MLAWLPVSPPDGSCLKRTGESLGTGLKGTVISPQNDGEPLDSHKLWPFDEIIVRFKVPIFVYITNIPVGYPAMDAPYNLNLTMTREFDIAANAARLVLVVFLVEFPDLKIVMSHLGGGIAAIMDRIENYISRWGEHLDRCWR